MNEWARTSSSWKWNGHFKQQPSFHPFSIQGRGLTRPPSLLVGFSQNPYYPYTFIQGKFLTQARTRFRWDQASGFSTEQSSLRGSLSSSNPMRTVRARLFFSGPCCDDSMLLLVHQSVYHPASWWLERPPLIRCPTVDQSCVSQSNGSLHPSYR
jgi:hypothetical protein